MPQRLVTPHEAVVTLVTGHFVSEAGYYAWRPRGTNDYLLIYTHAGLGRFGTLDGRSFLVQPGDVILIRPGTFQDYGVEESLKQWELVWAHFTPKADWLDLLDWPELEPGVHRLRLEQAANAVAEAFERLHRSTQTSDPLRDRLAVNALEALLLQCERVNPGRAAHRIDQRIRQTMDYVARHLGDKITLATLAEISELSVSRLAHRFGEVVGVSPMEYVERQRIERARQLLQMTSLSVKEIARQLGFSTQFYFSQRFKNHTGRSPVQFRRLSEQQGS
ncbi:MAG TPA: helix-turn-helix domain-containing protein [Tepidisphaeraceae bacterium]|jgi:AraC family transcriptional regulator of arabinose operon